MAQAPVGAVLPADARSRARAGVLGGFLADAATLPLHWIYDVPKLQQLLAAEGREARPEFFPTPSCPFYKAELGQQSCYGDELVPLLQSMAENGGEFDAIKYSEALHAFYTANDSYRNKSIKSVMQAYDEGKRGTECGDPTDTQANCFSKVPILVARYAGQPGLLKHVEAAVRVQQNNEAAVRYGVCAAKIMERVVLGSSVAAALAWAKDEPGVMEPEMQQLVATAVEASRNPPTELTYEPAPYMKAMVDKHLEQRDKLSPYAFAVWAFGPACGCPAALINVLLTAAMFGASSSTGGATGSSSSTSSTSSSSYVEGVRSNLTAGGDNASRSCLIGALLAAELQGGSDAVLPESWCNATARFKQLEGWVDVVVGA